MKKITRKWHVEASNIKEAEIIGKWFDQSEFALDVPNFYEKDAFIGCYGGVSPGNVHNNPIGVKLTFNDFVKYIVNEEHLIKPFIQTEDYNQLLIKLLGK